MVARRYLRSPAWIFPDTWRRSPATYMENAGHRGSRQKHIEPEQVARCAIQHIAQPVSWLRARLYLLLRAPHAQLSRPVAGAGFREQDICQGQCSRTIEARTCKALPRAGTACARRQYRCVPTLRAPTAPDTARTRSVARMRTSRGVDH